MDIDSVIFNYLVDTNLLMEFKHITSMDVFDKTVTSNVVMEDMPIYQTMFIDETISMLFSIENDFIHSLATANQVAVCVYTTLVAGEVYYGLHYDELLKIETSINTLCDINCSIKGVLLPFLTSKICAIYKIYLDQKSPTQISIDGQLSGLSINVEINAGSFIVFSCDAAMLAKSSILTEGQTISLKSNSLNAKIGRYRTISDISDYTMGAVGNWVLSGLYFEEKE